jgi:hypothetical protein
LGRHPEQAIKVVPLDAVGVYQRKILNPQPGKTHCEPGTKSSKPDYTDVSLSKFTLTGFSECADMTIDELGLLFA